MSLPRVILVGGAPLSGKSCLARGLSRRLDIAHISTDDLSTAIRAITDARSHPDLHYLDVDGPYRDYYPSHTPERLLEDAMAFHHAAWPAIEAVARAHASWDRPAVIEGWGLLPELVAGLGLARLGAVFVIPDERLFETRCRADTSFWEGAADEEGLVQSFALRSVLFSRFLDTSARACGLPVVRPGEQISPEQIVDLALARLE